MECADAIYKRNFGVYISSSTDLRRAEAYGPIYCYTSN
jgi:hypothetical protein